MKIKLDPFGFMPKKAHDADAGYDLYCTRDTVIPARGSATFDTGVHMAIPKGWYGKLESKSGLNVKHGVVSLGGVIDSGYTGAIVAKLYNMTDTPYEFKRGDKVVQIVFHRHESPVLELVDELDDTERGDGGFGSTGR